jgi:hypothetical protein
VLQEPRLAEIVAGLEEACVHDHRTVEETRTELLVAVERHYLT